MPMNAAPEGIDVEPLATAVSVDYVHVRWDIEEIREYPCFCRTFPEVSGHCGDCVAYFSRRYGR